MTYCGDPFSVCTNIQSLWQLYFNLKNLKHITILWHGIEEVPQV